MLSTIPSRRHSSAIADSPRSPDNTIRIFSSAEYRLRVARRISRTCCSAVSDGTDFCLIFAPSRATMSQKSSLRKIPQSVSQLLTGNRVGYLYQLAALWGWTSVPWLHRLTQPILIMAGTEDPIVPLVNAKIMQSFIRRCELFTIDDGHLFLITRAKEAASVVKQFLTGPIEKDLKISPIGIRSRVSHLARRLRFEPGRLKANFRAISA